jgi:hypothetical protein
MHWFHRRVFHFLRWEVLIDDLATDVVSLVVGDSTLALDDVEIQVGELVASFRGDFEELTESSA